MDLIKNPISSSLPEQSAKHAERPISIFKFRGRELTLGRETRIMGILNVTPDSFSDGGRFTELDKSLKQVEIMIAEGADIIDVGGESTKPGSDAVSEGEELGRVIPVIREIVRRFSVAISIDTTKAAVAEQALREGAAIVNDVSGLKFEPQIAEVAAKYKSGLIIMHTPSRPRDMQRRVNYGSLVGDIAGSLRESIELAHRQGVMPDSILIDPGFGFGKTPEQNLELLKRLGEFLRLGKPILIGTSRKSFIGRVLGAERIEDRAEGTLATVAIGIMNGASVVRVHDVLQARRAALIADAVMES
ncbi:MAG: dihydropteroate synthase [Deltaproteobacteria bacterium]